MNNKNILPSIKLLCGNELGASAGDLSPLKNFGVTEGTMCIAASRTQLTEYFPENFADIPLLEVVDNPLSAFDQLTRNAINQPTEQEDADMADLYFARH